MLVMRFLKDQQFSFFRGRSCVVVALLHYSSPRYPPSLDIIPHKENKVAFASDCNEAFHVKAEFQENRI